MNKLIACLAAALLTGCTTAVKDHGEGPALFAKVDRDMAVPVSMLAPPPFIREHSAVPDITTAPVRAAGGGLSLMAILETALPDFTVLPQDADVNLYKPVTIVTGPVRLEDLLQTLSALSGYDFSAREGVIEVSSFVTREYAIPFMATSSETNASVSGATAGGSSSASSTGSGSGGGGSSSGGSSRQLGSSINNIVDDWDATIEQIRLLIGATEGSSAIPSIDATGSQAQGFPGRPASVASVVGNKGFGLVHVRGPTSRMRAVDEYIDSLTRQASKQVRLDVRAIEVSFNDSKTIGVNWSSAINTIFNDALGSAGIALGADYSFSGEAGDGAFSLGAAVQSADDRIDAMVDFLSSYGNVQLRTEPQVTVINGRTAYIGSGEEFSYVANIEQTVSNGTVVSTPQFERILVGVELAITPRIRADNTIMLEAVPVISTFRAFDSFTIGNSLVQQPRIVLNQLATKVYTKSGQTVHLGGLITSRLNEAVKGLPVEQGTVLEKLLAPLFGGRSNLAERRELMLVVTPYLEQT